VRRMPWRKRRLANGECPLARRPARPVHPVAAGLFPCRRAQERANAAVVEQLSNEDIRNLGAYFASLPPPKPAEDTNPDLSKKGAQAAAGRRCAACHTDNYAGSKAAARLAGQREDYLVKALRDYKSGVRSGGGQAAMAEVAHPLSDEEIEALAHYLAYLK